MKFIYRQRVRITGGFFRGRVGEIRREYKPIFPVSLWQCSKYAVWIDDNTTVNPRVEYIEYADLDYETSSTLNVVSIKEK